MDALTARELAMDMPGTMEKDHFGKPSYSVKKKIYLTLWLDEERAVLKLTPEQQIEFCEAHPRAFEPVQNKWGKHGWTSVFLGQTNEKLFRYAMDLAWRNVTHKWLVATRQSPPKV